MVSRYLGTAVFSQSDDSRKMARNPQMHHGGEALVAWRSGDGQMGKMRRCCESLSNSPVQFQSSPVHVCVAANLTHHGPLQGLLRPRTPSRVATPFCSSNPGLTPAHMAIAPTLSSTHAQQDIEPSAMADFNTDDDERAEELATLQSIYPELTIDPNNPYAATLDLLVAPTKPLPVSFEPRQEVHRLEYLPPLHIDVVLPTNYPAEAPPSIQLATSPPWLPDDVIRRLVKEATSIWDEYGGSTVLFSYISSLQEQAETAFGVEALTLPSSLRDELVDYNRRTKRELFDNETFECDVCLEPKKGSKCHRMERCSHVFCVACLQNCYNSCIEEGSVNLVKCMSTECGKPEDGRRKKERLLSPKELLRIPISRDMVERYAKIKRKKKIESDPSMIFCPRSWCQGAMRTSKYPKITDVAQMDDSDSEEEEDDDPTQTTQPSDVEKRPVGVKGMDRLAICEDCALAFCAVCLSSWHGDFVRCEPRDAAQLTEEDQASLNFILKNTSPCPYCSVPCQKSHGCNHMTCPQCETHFCYLCGAWLNPDSPYQHYNDMKFKSCFQRLMDGVEGDMANGDLQFGGRRGAEQMADFWEQEAMRIQMQINDENTR